MDRSTKSPKDFSSALAQINWDSFAAITRDVRAKLDVIDIGEKALRDLIDEVKKLTEGIQSKSCPMAKRLAATKQPPFKIVRP